MNQETVVSTKPEFNKLQAAIWPIHKFEIKKFLPLGLMMFCILFIYTVCRTIKDTLVVSISTGGGAQSISVLKLFIVPVFAMLFMVLFNTMYNRMSFDKIFYSIVTGFLIIFAAFGFVIYPLSGYLHMSNETIQYLKQTVPVLSTIWPIIGNWTFSLFYVIIELWCIGVLSVLFWQFTNKITKMSEAKRFYGMLGLIGNIAPVIAGLLVLFLSDYSQSIIKDSITEAYGLNLRIQTTIVLFFGVILLLLFTWMRKNVLNDSRLFPSDDSVSEKKTKKMKMGIRESLKYISRYPYLIWIALLIIGYGTSINLLECSWKDIADLKYPDHNDYAKIEAMYFVVTGTCTTLVAVFVTNVLRKWKWKTVARLVPLIFLITGVPFLSLLTYRNVAGDSATIFGVNILTVLVFLGLILLGLAKGSKYSLFDATKNMAYIPLDPELKLRGQAAVESIGGSFGKAGGALVQQLLFQIFPMASLSSLVVITGPVVIIVLIVWLFAVHKVGKQFEILTEETKEDVQEKEKVLK